MYKLGMNKPPSAVSSLWIAILLLVVGRIQQVQAAFVSNSPSCFHSRISSGSGLSDVSKTSSFQRKSSLLGDLTLAGATQSVAKNLGSSSTTTRLYQSKTNGDNNAPSYNHVLVILAMPETSMSRIANEAILNTALQYTSKVSVVLRCESVVTPSLASLRKYVGEVYSQLWDYVLSKGDPDFANVIVYPNNLPNCAPEQWIHHLRDLDCVCSHDSICGWMTQSAQGRGKLFESNEGDGFGGLDQHVDAINRDREQRNLGRVEALHVENWPEGAYADFSKQNVIFIDDDIKQQARTTGGVNGDGDEAGSSNFFTVDNNDDCDEDSNVECLLGGAKIAVGDNLFRFVAVGGTFDGMHYGHRKLLTLAVSSVSPMTGKLFIGVTKDEMLQSKQYSELIPKFADRVKGVRDFVHQLAPGMKNRVIIKPITDAFGPPGSKEGEFFDALVLSDETLATGYSLNKYREETLGFAPLTLLCTRRTEPNGMSSTAIRRLRSQNLKQAASSSSRTTTKSTNYSKSTV